MQIVTLKPGNSVPLSKCENSMMETTIANNSKGEGKFVISFDGVPLSVQNKIASGHSITMCPVAGGTIENDGAVTLDVTTPGAVAI